METTFIETPSAACSGIKTLEFLQNVKTGERIRIRTKTSKLDEDFVHATAQRKEGAWELLVDGADNTEVIPDDDEKQHLNEYRQLGHRLVQFCSTSTN
jgi:hypothetical protein